MFTQCHCPDSPTCGVSSEGSFLAAAHPQTAGVSPLCKKQAVFPQPPCDSPSLFQVLCDSSTCVWNGLGLPISKVTLTFTQMLELQRVNDMCDNGKDKQLIP